MILGLVLLMIVLHVVGFSLTLLQHNDGSEGGSDG